MSIPKLPEPRSFAYARNGGMDGIDFLYSALQMQAYAIEHVAEVLQSKPSWDEAPEKAMWLAFKQETQEWCWLFVAAAIIGDDFIAREPRPMPKNHVLVSNQQLVDWLGFDQAVEVIAGKVDGCICDPAGFACECGWAERRHKD